MERLWFGLFVFRVVVALVGFAVFIYAMRTEPMPVRAVPPRLLAGLMVACVLAVGLAAMDSPQSVISDDICKVFPWLVECWFPW